MGWQIYRNDKKRHIARAKSGYSRDSSGVSAGRILKKFIRVAVAIALFSVGFEAGYYYFMLGHAGIAGVAQPALGNEAPLSSHSYTPTQGFVPDEATAVRIAEAVSFPVYGEESIKREEPFRVTLEDDIWTIEGKPLPRDVVGGIVFLQIAKTDARVMRMTHGR